MYHISPHIFHDLIYAFGIHVNASSILKVGGCLIFNVHIAWPMSAWATSAGPRTVM